MIKNTGAKLLYNFDFRLVVAVVALAFLLAIASLEKTPPAGSGLYYETAAKVVPAGGFKTKIVLGDSPAKLVEYGVIDMEKIGGLYESRGGLG